LNIDCNFVEPQHTVVTKKFLPRFKYEKLKVEKYQLALITSLGNLWVVDSIGHLGVDVLTNAVMHGRFNKIHFWQQAFRKEMEKETLP
jgi:hypothetical protein